MIFSTALTYANVLMLGVVDMIKAIYPPFQIPGFSPNFTGYNVDEDADWNYVYQRMTPNDSLVFVRNTSSVSFS